MSTEQLEKDKKEKFELLFVIGERIVNGFVYVFREETKEREIVGLGTPQEWDGSDYFSLKEALEKTLKEGGKKREISRVIFAVSPFWVDNQGNLTEQKETFLTSLCRDFGWKKGEFFVDDQALIAYFQTNQEIPPSFIALFVQEGEFRLSLVHLGKVKKRLRLVFQELTPQRVSEGLEQLGFEGILPPKFVIWGEVPSDFEEQMVNFPWVNQGGLFLHLPDVQVIDWPEMARIFRGAIDRDTRLFWGVSSQKEPLVSQEEKKEEATSLPEGFSFADLGEKEPVSETSSLEEEKQEKKEKRRISLPSFTTGRRLAGAIKRKAESFFFRGKLLFLFPLLVFLGLIGLWLTVYKVHLFLPVIPQQVKAEKEVVLGEKGELETVTLSERKEITGEEVATGTKTVGEKAKGEVTVYNRTGKNATFPKGTVIIGPGDLKFIFQEEVKIASKTPDLTSGVDKWGEAEVPVEAEKVGADYNLAAGSVFRIEGVSTDEFLVKNKKEFSGGMSREITAVDQEDINRLKTSLKEKLEDQLKQALKEKTGERKLLEETVKLKEVSFSTDKKAGEEGESFSGKLVMEITALALPKEALATLARKILVSKAPADFQLDSESIQVSFVPYQEEKEKWQGKIVVQADFYPRLDLQSLVNRLRGKPKRKILEIVKSQPRVYRYRLQITPSLMRFFPLLPLRKEQITISLEK